MATPLKFLTAVVLLALAVFSLFGFLASFEPGVNTWIWASGYFCLGLGSISIAAILLRAIFIRSGNGLGA